MTGAYPSKTLAAALVCLAVTVSGPAARADAAAGGAAFEKGDYVRAMAEWTSAAERGDPDAEFGLGMLYERGDGDVMQNYKEAVRWYEKAAAHDNFGAEYRLALIWAAGGDGFPADRVEAYKWILLAAEKGLALDVKAQLEQVLDRAQRDEAQKRADAWRAKQAALKADRARAAATAAPSLAPATATVPARAAGAPSAAGKPGGCPGWPFPTLPCTEQFPALPGATAPKLPDMPPPRAPGRH